ncbi:MAG: hypothetical protein ACLGHQ_07565 [Acidimicrobiia bacterium]
MTDLQDRTIATTRARQLPDVGPGPPDVSPPSAPPPTPPSSPTHGAPSWPRSAKAIVAVLAVAVLFAAFGTFAATRTDDDPVDDQQAQIDQLEAEQTRLTGELDAADARVADLTAQRDELDDRVAELDTQLATASADVEQLTAERTSLVAERDTLQASLAAAEAEVVDLGTRLDTAVDLTATLDERLAILDVQVGYLLDRAVSAEQERDTLLDLFPIEFESSLHGVDLTGDWNLSWDEAYCNAFPTCGSNPAFGRISITETPQRWLRVEADGVFDAGLFEVEGALYAITQSRTAAPACGLDQRVAHVGLTLYAHDVSVLEDGSHVIDDLAATYVVEAPPTAACPAAVAVYSAALTPVG